MAAKRLALVGADCVACGNCGKYCPFGAIAVKKGLRAVVDAEKCKGCGKCVTACPADVVACINREDWSA